jgi:hypothetical protein
MAMMRWALSDGTAVSSNGKAISVSGGSAFAQYLARRAKEPELLVPEFPEPGDVPLDPGSARNIDAWLEYELLEEPSVLIQERPEFEPLPTPPAEEPDAQGRYRIY